MRFDVSRYTSSVCMATVGSFPDDVIDDASASHVRLNRIAMSASDAARASCSTFASMLW